MEGEIDDTDAAIEAAKEYAKEECVGELGEVLDAKREENSWVIEFRTHTFSDEYEHRVRVSSVGNVFSHERQNRHG